MFLLRVVRQFALAEGREKFDEVLSPARARWFQGGRPIHRGNSNGEFVCFRTDVKSYHASIDHEILIGILAEHVADSSVLDLLTQYVQHPIYEGGLFEDVERGISLGCPLSPLPAFTAARFHRCPLSPLMGALYLKRLDERIEATGLIYARFMDDWVILAPTRWKLRAAVRIVNETLAELNVEQHPDKTFIGRVERGF
ncbi:MAG: hypothetical protein DWI02_10210, partial [Planctomycetota bacterium]